MTAASANVVRNDMSASCALGFTAPPPDASATGGGNVDDAAAVLTPVRSQPITPTPGARDHSILPQRAALPSTGTLAPINGVSANSGARVLSAVPLPARLAQWRARCWLARAATAIRGFADGASGPPDARCIRGRTAEPIGTFDAYIHPSATQRRPAAVYPIRYG